MRFTLQIVKFWISPVAHSEAQIAPHQQFVQSVDCAVKKKEVHGWSDNHHSCARDDTSLTSFAKCAIWLNLPEEQADLKD